MLTKSYSGDGGLKKDRTLDQASVLPTILIAQSDPSITPEPATAAQFRHATFQQDSAGGTN